MVDLSVVILTYNEEIHIGRCLAGALALTPHVYVVDSFSRDATRAIAESAGARVWEHEYKTHAAQLQWAIDNLPIETGWVMKLDADEVISGRLSSGIRAGIASASPGTTGFLVSRYATFCGKLIRHGIFPQWQLRLWRKGIVSIEQRWMDEHLLVREGEVGTIVGELIDDNLNNLSWWVAKHDRYASQEAVDLLNRVHGFLLRQESTGAFAGAIGRRRWLKDNIYLRAPAGMRAFLLFAYRMVFRLGILDGPRGFAFHFMQGLWYRYLVDLKIREVERRMREQGVGCVEAIRRELGIDPTA